MPEDATRKILLGHYARYPGMLIEDAYKLLHQSEFAGGHLICDKAEAVKRLEEEYSSARVGGFSEEFEYIGGGLYRLDLRALDSLGITPATAAGFFIATASSVKGSVKGFEDKLGVLRQCCRDGELPFDPKEAEEYIAALKAKGYHPVSHSASYRDAYSPHYRVVACGFRDYIKVFSRIDSLMKEKGFVTVAIDGNCGAGKSTLAALIADVYDCSVFHMDDFFLRPEQRTPQRLNEAGGNVDYERVYGEVLEGIASGKAFSYRRYDCKTAELGLAVNVAPKRLNVVEGSYSLHPALSGHYDLKIFLSIDEDEQKKRILERSGAQMYERFRKEWIPMENRYFSELRIKQISDIVY